MKYTNINITSPYGQMVYYLEYVGSNQVTEDAVGYVNNPDSLDIVLNSDFSNLSRDYNEWTEYVFDETSAVTTYLPATKGVSTLTVYFPRFSADTYNFGIKYAIDINTWVHGHKIVLCSKLIDRNDVLAVDRVRRFNNHEFYEYINVDFCDPWDITYSDDWKEFRQHVCGEPEIEPIDINGENNELNSTGSVICVTLHPIYKDDDGLYREIDDFYGGQNSINLADEVTDYLAFVISDDRNIAPKNLTEATDNKPITITTDIIYNDSYSHTVTGFKEYMYETYQIKDFTMKLEMIIRDKDNLYKYDIQDFEFSDDQIEQKYLLDQDSPFIFDNWNGYKEGMYMNMILSIITDETEDNLIYLRSNQIPVTRDLFKYLIRNDDNIYKIDITQDMNIYNINAVNKIKQEIIQMERPDDYKANIIKPVFFRVHELGRVVLHPGVVEQICINLDAYKSKVDTFIFKVNGVAFPEFGRNASGVIFKIDGNQLVSKNMQGTFYILNENSELVTTGQYIYEQ